MRLHEPSSSALKIFILRQWKAKVRAKSKNDIDEVETFLRDIRERRDKQFEITPLLEGLAGLNVGPMRSFASGSCTIDELDQVIEESFDDTVGSPPWHEHFIQII
jgi:hypothetical protein